MVFWHASGALMSVFADDLLVVCKKRSLGEVRKMIDAELKIVWGDALIEAGGWVRYLGKEWRCQNGDYSVR
eukprot:12473984-Heterocapsa_arctica.AAC.1